MNEQYTNENLSPRATIPEALKVKKQITIDITRTIYDCFMQEIENRYNWINKYDWNEHDFLQASQIHQVFTDCILFGGDAVYTLGYLSGARAVREKYKRK